MALGLKLIGLSVVVVTGFLTAAAVSYGQSATSPAVTALESGLIVTLQGGQLGVEGLADSETSEAILSLVKTMHSARVTATGSSIRVAGTASKESDWTAALASFRNQLPVDGTLVVDVLLIDDSLDVDSFCSRIFRAISDVQIGFRPSSSDLRPSSYATLDRLIDFASNCRNSVIHIVGHSDNNGNDDFNMRLSRMRAQAVADYLQSRGVAANRLSVSGKGAAEPIADNGTVTGRARNRRIEFALRPLERP